MAATRPPRETDETDYDPVFLHARREAKVILAVWLLALLWTVSYCYRHGFPPGDADPESLQTVWGIPSWLFWGVFAAWMAAVLFTLWFCGSFMHDDDLGERDDLTDRHGGEEEAP